ncbi:hypothetical protein Taro_044067, partial [Colocasia esculenta]|nr:hypothetical protein [Colocasia esculenta]
MRWGYLPCLQLSPRLLKSPRIVGLEVPATSVTATSSSGATCRSGIIRVSLQSRRIRRLPT